MSTVIIVTGFLATLKSTISKRLSADLGFVCINKDDLKETIVDNIGFTNRNENLTLSKVSIELIKDLTKLHINNNSSIIIEANFKQHELIELNEIIGNTSSITIFTFGDIETIYKRYVKRFPTQHIAHTSSGFITFDNFKKYNEEYSIESCFGKTVKVDTTVFNDDSYNTLIESIQKYLDEK